MQPSPTIAHHSEQPPPLFTPAAAISPLCLDRRRHPDGRRHCLGHGRAADTPVAECGRRPGPGQQPDAQRRPGYRPAGRRAASAGHAAAARPGPRRPVDHPRHHRQPGRGAHAGQLFRRLRRRLAVEPGPGQPARNHVRPHPAPAQPLFRRQLHRHHPVARGVRRQPGGPGRPERDQRGRARLGGHGGLPGVAVQHRLAAGRVLPGPAAAGGHHRHLRRAPHAPPEPERPARHGRADQCARREHQRPARGQDLRWPGLRAAPLRPRRQAQPPAGRQARLHGRHELGRHHAAGGDHAVVGDLLRAAAGPGRRPVAGRLRRLHGILDGDAVAHQEPDQD